MEINKDLKPCIDCDFERFSIEQYPCCECDNTTLKDIDTSRLHYVSVPENHIVIDFDIKDRTGNKNFELNFNEAIKWPQTYAELSKSGSGIHLHQTVHAQGVKNEPENSVEEITTRIDLLTDELNKLKKEANLHSFASEIRSVVDIFSKHGFTEDQTLSIIMAAISNTFNK